MLWSEYKDEFLSSLSVNGGKLHAAKATEVLGRFTRYMDPVYVSGITQMTYNHYLVRRQNDPGIRRGTTVSKQTVNGDKAYLNMAFRWVDQLGRQLAGVPDNWRIPQAAKAKIGKRKPKKYTSDEVNRVLEACVYARKPLLSDVSPKDWWLTFWCLDLFTGFRKNALLHFPRPTDAELDAGEVVLSHEWNKSGCDQSAYLPAVLVDRIRQLPALPGGTLLPWPHGHRCFYDTLHHMQSRAGIPLDRHIMPHGGRSLFTTNLISGGASIALVQQLLGHSTPQLLMDHYLNDVTPEKRQAVNRIPIPPALAMG